ncbi:MAG: hypothetical protein LBJ67_00320 [Planctomycetaceae bacterium]|jgi:hypothetical protein|nr:hypothetical protein [Planctomycetaceae bacterium]
MFKLHDKTRRWITLLVFLLLGPALLIMVLTRVAERRSVKTVTGWEAVMTNILGRRVTIESIAFPAPGIVRLSQFSVFDDETNDVLLQIPQWELIEMTGEMPIAAVPQNSDKQNSDSSQSAAFYDSYISRTPYKRNFFSSVAFFCSSLWGTKQRYYLCEIPQISCNETAAPQVRETLNALLMKIPYAETQGGQPVSGIFPVTLLVGEIHIFPNSQKTNSANVSSPALTNPQNSLSVPYHERTWAEPTTFKNLQAEFRPQKEKTVLAAAFQFQTKNADAQTLRLTVSRERQTSPSTTVRLTTANAVLPTRWLASFLSFFASFGEQSSFCGELIFTDSKDMMKQRSRRLELHRVLLADVSLDTFLREPFPFSVTGKAERLAIASAAFGSVPDNPAFLRLERVEGAFWNGQGNVNWSGLKRLVQGIKLHIVPPHAAPPETDVSFRNASLAFLFDADGIRIRSVLPNAPFLTIDNHCEIHPPGREHFIHYNELLTALSRPTSPQIPLMDETLYLMSAFPVIASENATQKLLTNSLLSSETSRPQSFSIPPQNQQDQPPSPPQPQLNQVPSLHEILQSQSSMPQSPSVQTQSLPPQQSQSPLEKLQYATPQPSYNSPEETMHSPFLQPNNSHGPAYRYDPARAAFMPNGQQNDSERVYISKISPSNKVVQSNPSAGILNLPPELLPTQNHSNLPRIATVPPYVRYENNYVTPNNSNVPQNNSNTLPNALEWNVEL